MIKAADNTMIVIDKKLKSSDWFMIAFVVITNLIYLSSSF